MKNALFFIASSLLFWIKPLQAQMLEDSQKEATGKKEKTIRVAANPQYDKAKTFKRLVFGDHYRKEWAVTVEVEILDMDSVSGGLTPLRLGGGLQTKSLRLAGSDGKEYVLRSVNKDPSKALPPEMVGTYAADVLQDQISSSHPFAPLVVTELAEAAGIFHSWPKMVWVPSSPRLGDFNKDFGNTLCLFEERPNKNQQDNLAFGNARSIVNSEKLFEKLRQENDHFVDERSFAKARIFDMWIGDWDRHEDQWLWAVFKEGDHTIYKPIPRDHDQAFARLDGVIPWLAARKWAVRKTKNFDNTLKDVDGFNMNASLLDRRLTTRLYLKDWLEMASELEQSLTDQKIEHAFEVWPKAVFDISGKQMIATLKKRRAQLKNYATSYYSFLSELVNVVGTDKSELFEIVRKTNDSTLVRVYKLSEKDEVKDLLFERTFLTRETKEIRLYGLNGNDRFRLEGIVNKSSIIRIIGGGGKDSVIDQSIVSGWKHMTKVYDSEMDKIPSKEVRYFISSDSAKNAYVQKRFQYDWLAPKLAPGYNPDDGVYIGGGIILKKQQFGKFPFGHMQSIWANYAFATGAYNFGYEGIFKETVGHWDLNLNMRINAPNYVINYFGDGNETVTHNNDRNYNRVRSNQWNLSTSLSRQLGRHHFIDAGVGYQSVEVEQNENRFVNSPDAKLDSFDFQKNHFGQLQTAYQFATIDNPLYPTKGVRISSSIRFSQNLDHSAKNYVNLGSDISYYVSLRSLTMALRTGAYTNWGNGYEFYQGNTLGSSTNLRGFRRDRFTGKTSWYQNTELRLKFNELNGYIFRGNYGMLTFLDAGRVWIPNENSDKVHLGYGGGIWFLPYNRIAFTATYHQSKEDKFISLKAGFLF